MLFRSDRLKMGSSNAEGSGGGDEMGCVGDDIRCTGEDIRCAGDDTRCTGDDTRCTGEDIRCTGDASGYRSSDCVDTMGASNGKFKRARSP